MSYPFNYEYIAYTELIKIAKKYKKDTLILRILWRITHMIKDPKMKAQLPSFFKLFCKILPDPTLWNQRMEEFKNKFLGVSKKDKNNK